MRFTVCGWVKSDVQGIADDSEGRPYLDGFSRIRRIFGKIILEGAEGGGADGEAGTAGGGEGNAGGGGDFIPFAVDEVVFKAVGGDGAEGVEADAEGEVVHGHAASGEGGEEGGSEMKAGSGRGGGDFFRGVGVNGLVAGGVAGALGVLLSSRMTCAVNVRREGRLAEAVGEVGDGGAVGNVEADEAAAVGMFFEDGGGEGAGFAEDGAGREFAAGFEEAPPGLAARVGDEVGMEQEAFAASAGGAGEMQASLEDGGVVAEEAGAGRQQIGQVAENMVGDAAGGALDDEEAGGIARVGGLLRDATRRERVIEEGGVHDR